METFHLKKVSCLPRNKKEHTQSGITGLHNNMEQIVAALWDERSQHGKWDETSRTKRPGTKHLWRETSRSHIYALEMISLP